MPTCYVLVGVPASGKSTWVKRQNFDWNKTVLVSTDNYVELRAEELGVRYSDIFDQYMPTAVKLMTAQVKRAVEDGMDIVWDQTSTTEFSRLKKFRMLPNYQMIAVVFATPPMDVLQARLNSRPGKIIPKQVMEDMLENFVIPSIDEGFDKIIEIPYNSQVTEPV